jgi:hypothetical protein
MWLGSLSEPLLLDLLLGQLLGSLSPTLSVAHMFCSMRGLTTLFTCTTRLLRLSCTSTLPLGDRLHFLTCYTLSWLVSCGAVLLSGVPGPFRTLHVRTYTASRPAGRFFVGGLSACMQPCIRSAAGCVHFCSSCAGWHVFQLFQAACWVCPFHA